MTNEILDRSQALADTQSAGASVSTLAGDHRRIDTQRGVVSGIVLADGQESGDSQSSCAVGTTLGNDHYGIANTQSSTVVPDTLGSGQLSFGIQAGNAAVTQSSPAKEETSSKVIPPVNDGRETISGSTPIVPASLDPYLFTPELGLLAQQLDDFENLRKAQANRLRIFTRDETDADGEMRGFALDEDNPAVIAVQINLDQLSKLEHETVLALQKAMRRNPLNEWRKTQLGIGEKTLARLLNAIGDPYVRMDNHQPRTVSELWAYCGLHTLPSATCRTNDHTSCAEGTTLAGSQSTTDTHLACAPGSNIAAKRMKGVKANWSTIAKTRAYLIAEACVKAGVRKDADGNRYAKNGSEYAQLYIDRRNHTAVTHPEWTPLHSQNDALRIVSKRILRNLWRAARDIHMNDKEVPDGD